MCDALGRITNILVQDANHQKLSETTYNYSAGKTTITETKDSVTTTTITDVTNSPLNWTDVAEKLAKGFNQGWNREASSTDSLTYKIGNYAGAFLADASDLFPAVGIIEAITGYRFLGHRLLNPQERITALSSAAMSILPIGIITKSVNATKPLLSVSNSVGTKLLPSKLYHYTRQENAANILEHGLQPGAISGKIFTTSTGIYTPVEAQMYLGLSPNRGLPNALIEIDTSILRSLGIKPSAGPMRVLPTPNAKGYGTEIIFEQAIPPGALRQIH